MFTIPFAESGARNIVPVTTSEFGRASLRLGFPPETSILISQGGAAPKGADFNGMFYHITQYLQWIQSGGLWTYDAMLDYAPPSIVYYNNNFYTCLAENGPGTAAGVQPPANRDYWVTLGSKITLPGGDAGQVLTKLSPADGDVEWKTIIPVGVIWPFASQVLPAGFLECNGADANRIVYADLFTAIGTDWGSSSPDTFRLPDYRGKFLRGFDANAGVDAGRVFGTTQQDALQNITGSISIRSYTDGRNIFAGLSGAFVDGGAGANNAATTAIENGLRPANVANFAADLVARTAEETRPINETVIWGIKY